MNKNIYVIYTNQNGNETGMTTQYNWNHYPEQHHLDTEDEPNKIVHTFEAIDNGSHDEARKIYHKYFSHS